MSTASGMWCINSWTSWWTHHKVSEEMQMYSNIQKLNWKAGSTFNFRKRTRSSVAPSCRHLKRKYFTLTSKIWYDYISLKGPLKSWYIRWLKRLLCIRNCDLNLLRANKEKWLVYLVPQGPIPFSHICHGPWFLLISGVCTASHIFTALSASKFPTTALLYLYHNHNSVLSFQTLFPEQICR